MKNTLIISFLLVVILLFSCTTETKSDLSVNEIELNAPYTESLLLSQISSSVSVVPLEAKAESLIGEISRIRVIDNRIYILDTYIRPGLYVFDIDGTHLFSLNQDGRGPGEFTNVQDFDVVQDIDRIIVFDRTQRKYSWFDMDGNFIEDQLVEYVFESFLYLGDDTHIYYHGYSPSPTGASLRDINLDDLPDSYDNISVVQNGRVVNSFLPYEIDFHRKRGGFLSDNFTTYDGRVFFQKTYDDFVYEVSAEEIQPFIKIKFGDSLDYESFFGSVETVPEVVQYMNQNQPAYNASNLHFFNDSLLGMKFIHRGWKTALVDLDSSAALIYDNIENDYNDFEIRKDPLTAFKNHFVYQSVSRFSPELVEGGTQCCMTVEAIANLRTITEDFDNPVLVLAELDINKVRELINSEVD